MLLAAIVPVLEMFIGTGKPAYKPPTKAQKQKFKEEEQQYKREESQAWEEPMEAVKKNNFFLYRENELEKMRVCLLCLIF
jgi:hypothetical protein